MSADWQENNRVYLAAAVEWLRCRIALRLDAVAELGAKPVAAAAVPGAAPAGRRLWRGDASTRTTPALLLPNPAATDAGTVAAGEREAAEALTAAGDGQPRPALAELAERLSLTPFERDTLLLAVAREIEPALFARQDRTPSFATATALFDDPEWNAASPDRPLRAWQLVRLEDAGLAARATAPIVADERVVSFARGVFHLDERIAPFVTPVPSDAAERLPPSQRHAAETLGGIAAGAGVVALTGPDRAGKRRVAAVAAGAAGLALYRLGVDMLPADVAQVRALARLWHRETLLAPLGLLVEADEGGDANALRHFAGRTGGFVAVATDDPVVLDFGRLAQVAVALPTPAEQRETWARALGEGRDALAVRLAEHFALGTAEIEAIAAQAASAGDAEVWGTAREQTRPADGGLVGRVEARARRDDLVLPAREMALIDALIGQVGQRGRVYDDWGFRERLNRGLGISALFAGPSGTGKTMAAEVIANALELDLYRIDLASVVSKYIGETEKQLARVFDMAERGGGVLLFDEADALFGKRSEVKDSHDRYANIEIDYLLQRLEAFTGVAILTTNMRTSLDPAFTRRLRFIVDFPYPDVEERRRIWARALPAAAPVEALDVARLAQLDLSGGDIHAVALGASFDAAAAGTPVTMDHLFEAARRELRKLDRPVAEADFRVVPIARGMR
ncbi:ATP-binding protein [Sphingomonas sp.]|uniref:ATP-binding protein n=1 Tax=Sphingomonas sp. TaxID=28214 RepID=UPI0035BC705A